MAKNDYPDKALQAEIKTLLLRCGIEPTRPRMNAIKAMTGAEAARTRRRLTAAAVAAERARAEHPEGRRSTTKQLALWHHYFVTVNRREPDAADLTHFLNLDTKTANNETTSLKWQHRERQDREGLTPAWRVRRGLFADTHGERRLRLDEL